MRDNGESTPVNRNDLRMRLSSAAGGSLGAVVALVFYPDFGSIWLGLLAFLATAIVGCVLGRIVGAKMFGKR